VQNQTVQVGRVNWPLVKSKKNVFPVIEFFSFNAHALLVAREESLRGYIQSHY